MQVQSETIGESRYAAHVRRFFVAFALLIAALSAPAAVFASDGAATPFKAVYTATSQYGVSTWTCSGSHVVNRVSVKDSETCLITGNTTGFVAGTYVGQPQTNIPPFGVSGWGSDYNNVEATSFTLTLLRNSDGSFTLDITAYYP